MSLEVPTPDPPEISSAPDEDAYAEVRRAELQEYLEDGAWERAFDDWSSNTDLTEQEFEVVTDLNLFEEFEFFWDRVADRVGYDTPGIDEDWRERDDHPALDGWSTVSAINAELSDLGRTVRDVLEDEYIDWDDLDVDEKAFER